MLTAELLRAYAATTYEADAPGGRLRFRLGERNAAADEVLAGAGVESWAIVTAWNPSSEPRAAAENEAAHAALVRELERQGLARWSGDGRPDDGNWPVERGCCVLNVSEDVVRVLCRQFGQVAAVYGRRGEPPWLLLADVRSVGAVLDELAGGPVDDPLAALARETRARNPVRREG